MPVLTAGMLRERKKRGSREKRTLTRIGQRAEYVLTWEETITELPNPVDPTYRVYGWGPSYSSRLLNAEGERLKGKTYKWTYRTYDKEEVDSLISMIRTCYPFSYKTIQQEVKYVTYKKYIQDNRP